MGHIIGIDLGTTNSVVAIMEGGEARVIPNEEGSRTTPSVVAIDEANNILVGQVARRQAITNPTNTIYSVKRLMGRAFADVEDELRRYPYDIVEADNKDAAIQIGARRYAPPEISARILMKLKRAAEKYLGEEVTEAVITVPAYFNDVQRVATKNAGAIAGLNVRRLINEPTAAALAYGHDTNEDRVVAVFDFGGGTFDISILDIGDSVVEVIATAGDNDLGGDNIDELIIDYLAKEFENDTQVDVSEDKMALQRLKDAAEKAKIELSSTLETHINLPFLTADASGPKHLNIRMSRAKLEYLIVDLIDRTLAPCRQALTDAGKRVTDIDEVILVGGSTRIPLVQTTVENFFGQSPVHRVNPDEVVALGAAVQAAVLSGEIKDLITLDVTSLTLGVETRGGIMAPLIERNTTIPVKRSKTFTTAVDNQDQVEIHVVQGEREFVKDNISLGRFILDNIPAAPRATPKIEVTFDIDANGIVNVSAKEEKTGRAQEITVQPSGGLSDGEIRRLLEEAAEQAEADKKQRRAIEARNRLDGMIMGARRALRGDMEIPADAERAALGAELADAEALLKDDDASLDALHEANDKVARAMTELSNTITAARKAREEAEQGQDEGDEDAKGDAAESEGVEAEESEEDEASGADAPA